MVKRMKKVIVFSVLAAIFFYNGCGVVGLLGTPSRHERKIPAEYDLTKRKNQKILILVEQPGWLSTQANLRYYLTEAIRENLTAKVEVPPEYIISYNELSEFRSNKSDFPLLSPATVGRALGADIVLLVMLEDYQLSEVAETGYYGGFLGAQTVLFETATGEKLWPESAESKSIRVGFEVEQQGQEAAVGRLVAACAYCTTRYLYNCPKDKFKISDDRSHISWEEWKK
jgi:hypothetical protein